MSDMRCLKCQNWIKFKDGEVLYRETWHCACEIKELTAERDRLLEKFQKIVGLYERELGKVKDHARKLISPEELETICSDPLTAHDNYWKIIEGRMVDGDHLREALEKYGWHLSDCLWYAKLKDCTCGLKEALAPVKDEGKGNF